MSLIRTRLARRAVLATVPLLLGAGASLGADVPDETSLSKQIKQWMADPPRAQGQTDYMKVLADRRKKVIELANTMLKAYPQTKDRDEVLMAKLESLYIVAIVGAQPLNALEAEVDRVLAGKPSADLAAYAAYVKVQVKVASNRRKLRKQTIATQKAITTTQMAQGQAEFELQRYKDYVAKYPKSQFAPNLLEAIIKDAWDRSDRAAADQYFNKLQTDHPRHVVTERVRAAHRQRRAIGKPLQLAFTSTDGQKIDVQKMKGHVVIVDFWATWCPPCRKSIPHLKSLYERHGPRGLRIIGINLDTSRSKLDDYVRRQAMSWPQHFDGKGWGNDIAKQFGVQSIPAVYVVDTSGVLRAISPADLDATVERLLREQSDKDPPRTS